jgi:hypothetical protein
MAQLPKIHDPLGLADYSVAAPDQQLNEVAARANAHVWQAR